MLSAGLLSFVVLSLASVPICLADISLIVPGFDPQALSANIIGVGADGETTYQILPGQPTGTLSAQNPASFGTVTLIEGASNAVLEYANSAVTVVESCTLGSGLAGCVDVFPGLTTLTAQVTATPILVQGGGTVSSGSGSSAVPAPTTSAPGSSTATTPSASASITPSQSTSSGVRLTPAKVAGLAGMLAIWTVLH